MKSSTYNRTPSAMRLPAPGSGWQMALIQAIVVAALWAVAVFAMTALLLPTAAPECAIVNDVQVCPHPESRNPALTHLLDVRWPAVDELWGPALVFAPMLLANEGMSKCACCSGKVSTFLRQVCTVVGLMPMSLAVSRIDNPSSMAIRKTLMFFSSLVL